MNIPSGTAQAHSMPASPCAHYPVLLLGGTAESAELICALAQFCAPVLFSTATDEPLALPADASLYHRITGRLDVSALAKTMREHRVRLLVCAVHPYAAAARENAVLATTECQIPILVYLRQATSFTTTTTTDDATHPPLLADGAENAILFADSHEQAAQMAFHFRAPVLLTTGSRNLQPYAQAARQSGGVLFARMLDNAEAHAAAEEAGIAPQYRITARGPFTVKENCAQIRRTGAEVVVSKDGGAAGGMREKLEAVRLCGCRMILVRRPEYAGAAFASIPELAARAQRLLYPEREMKTGM